MSETFQMRAKCRCGHEQGFIETKNGQDCVYCGKCGRYQYCAPKTETGREPRKINTGRTHIKPGRRASLLLRDNGRCVLCGSKDNLHIGHLLSVAEGLRQGLTEEQINDDENLATMCDGCNLGLSDTPVPLRLMVAVLMARLKLKGDDDAHRS